MYDAHFLKNEALYRPYPMKRRTKEFPPPPNLPMIRKTLNDKPYEEIVSLIGLVFTEFVAFRICSLLCPNMDFLNACYFQKYFLN